MIGASVAYAQMIGKGYRYVVDPVVIEQGIIVGYITFATYDVEDRSV